MTEGEPLRVFLIAGEPSGDRLGAALIRGLGAESARPLALMGIGGAAMRAEGLESRFDIEEIAVMGIAEVLPRLRAILARISQTADAVVDAAPDIVVSIDAPDFGLRVVKKARPILRARAAEAGLAAGASLAAPLFVHYVAPSVWAWRPGRAKKYAARLDHLLALLPFEPPYFEAEGLSCEFVGHPIVEKSGTRESRAADAARFRRDLEIPPEAPLLALLPGSRSGEVKRLLPVFRDTVATLVSRRPDLLDRGLRLVMPLAEHRAEAILADPGEWPVRTHFLDPRGMAFEAAEARKFAAFAASDAALAASGTVSLELAAARTPMVIAYKVSPLTAFIVRRLLRIDTATLVNLVSETRAVPEFLQENCRPDLMAESLSDLLPGVGAPSYQREAQLAAQETTMRALGEGAAPPSQRAARSVLEAVGRRSVMGRP